MSLHFWLGVGAAQKSAKSKACKSTERRGHRVASIVIGILLAILLIAALFCLFLLSQS